MNKLTMGALVILILAIEANGSLVGTTNSTRNENSVQSLQHGEEVTRQKHLLDPGNFSKETALVNPAPTHDHLLSIIR